MDKIREQGKDNHTINIGGKNISSKDFLNFNFN
jgi:hypothetical protein